MTLSKLSVEALVVRDLYAKQQTHQGRPAWGPAEFAQGFVGDVGDLMKLVMAKQGLRSHAKLDAALRHELADCLWSILVLADAYEVDLESAFSEAMTGLQKRLKPRRRTKTAQTSRVRRD